MSYFRRLREGAGRGARRGTPADGVSSRPRPRRESGPAKHSSGIDMEGVVDPFADASSDEPRRGVFGEVAEGPSLGTTDASRTGDEGQEGQRGAERGEAWSKGSDPRPSGPSFLERVRDVGTSEEKRDDAASGRSAGEGMAGLRPDPDVGLFSERTALERAFARPEASTGEKHGRGGSSTFEDGVRGDAGVESDPLRAGREGIDREPSVSVSVAIESERSKFSRRAEGGVGDGPEGAPLHAGKMEARESTFRAPEGDPNPREGSAGRWLGG